jgi:hypothetical protein
MLVVVRLVKLRLRAFVPAEGEQIGRAGWINGIVIGRACRHCTARLR